MEAVRKTLIEPFFSAGEQIFSFPARIRSSLSVFPVSEQILRTFSDTLRKSEMRY